MSNFELFCIMYKSLDNEENHKNVSFEDFLSDLDPFVWQDCGSADPAEYSEFCNFMNGKIITDDYGFSLIYEYLSKIDRPWVDSPISSFFTISKENWIELAKEYISSPHKK